MVIGFDGGVLCGLIDLCYAFTEPLAKVVSGNLLPHFGVFSGWIFEIWNHHILQSILKTH